MDSLRCTDLLHARAQKLQLPGEVQSNSCRSHGIPDVWLSNAVSSEFFRLFESKSRSIGLSAKKSYLSRSCDSMRKKIFFSLFHHLFSLCSHITLCHSRRPRSSCYNFITSHRIDSLKMFEFRPIN